KSTIEWNQKDSVIKLISDDDFKMKAVIDIVTTKIFRRGIDIRTLEVGKVETGAAGLVKCDVKLKQGVPQETGKAIVKDIKEAKMKVQAQIQENQVRVSGKKRDDLQEAIALVKSKDYKLPLQFTNFRE
ncbi:MAG: DUF520 family protein, partial [Deltaproteobacteria bacterium]|nr:DUF520 family protein [Deltaproteobacteria bacterium]